ncbi:hypothetical protein SDC9_63007 [bioreactor metagenome]|uniref:Uncharacterized protein n=1 Tax=bioreactor metagenome TaxID=1076179 RepID=A0A644XKA0_9ZZZZ
MHRQLVATHGHRVLGQGPDRRTVHRMPVGDRVAAAVAVALDLAVLDPGHLAAGVGTDVGEGVELPGRGLGEDVLALGEDDATAHRDLAGGDALPGLLCGGAAAGEEGRTGDRGGGQSGGTEDTATGVERHSHDGLLG